MALRYKVVIIQRLLPRYRKTLFELLKERLARSDVELILVYGVPAGDEVKKVDTTDISWGHRIENRCLNIGSRLIYWQPCLPLLQNADLVIVEQAGKLLLNYILFLKQLIGFNKLCFWGHGKNFQEHSASLIGESVKRFMSRRVHWWFAYNDLSASVIKALGYPADRITSVQNAIDTRRLVEIRQKITSDKIEKIKHETGIEGNNVGLYVGGMYREKRLDFLIEACVQIKKQVPDFEMILIGAGPESCRVRIASEENGWFHYLGPKFDDDKVPYFILAKLFLMPGLVGLSVLDSFALETPLVTTNITYHSPEIAYLADGVNGVIIQSADDPLVYANQVSYLLKNHEAREKLVEGCRIARYKYTIEEMVERFAVGVIHALSL